jgi:hypothetical protein
MPRGPAVYTVGRQLGDGQMYIFSLFDLEPAGILVSRRPSNPASDGAQVITLMPGRCATDSGLLPINVQRTDNITHRVRAVFGGDHALGSGSG